MRARSGDPSRDDVTDAKDSADVEARVVVADAEVERDLAELRDVNLALQRVEDGTYGICNDCGNRIDPRRVLAQPTALRCLDCQALAEAEATRTASGHTGRRA